MAKYFMHEVFWLVFFLLQQFKITFGNQHFLQQKSELDQKFRQLQFVFQKRKRNINFFEKKKKKKSVPEGKTRTGKADELQPVSTWSERVKLPVYFNSSSFFSRVREVVYMTTQL